MQMSTERTVIALDVSIFDIPELIKSLRAEGAYHLSVIADQIEAQTRPPKPPEPQGLGAVVEDRDGTLWTRFTREYDYDAVWSHETSHRGNTAYADIDAVRVLFGGVQP